jgi:hypothetical protein
MSEIGTAKAGVMTVGAAADECVGRILHDQLQRTRRTQESLAAVVLLIRRGRIGLCQVFGQKVLEDAFYGAWVFMA